MDIPQILILENLSSNGSKILSGETTLGKRKGKFQTTQHPQLLTRKGYHPGNVLEAQDIENIHGSSQERGMNAHFRFQSPNTHYVTDSFRKLTHVSYEVAKPVSDRALTVKEKRSTKEEL